MPKKTVRDLFEQTAQIAISYRDEVDQVSPYASATADTLRLAFDTGLPKQGRDGPAIIHQLAQAAGPGLLGVSGDAFYGWVMGGSHPVGVAADWLTSTWGQNAGIYQTAPAAAIAEEIAGKWLIDLLNLPPESSIGFTTGATMASFICLATARQDVLARHDWNLDANGMFGAPEVSVYLGEEAHSSIFAALRFLGFGQNRLKRIEAESDGCMSPEALQATVRNDNGPKIIISQAGHINSGAFDDFDAISKIAEASDAWLHIDGAFGLWARSVQSKRHLCKGAKRADSWAVDGHKWLQVPYDSGYAIIKDADAHRSAMAITASYLNQDPEDGPSPSHYVPELSRRARGFATWAVLQALGRDGVTALVDDNCRNAQHLAKALGKIPGVHLMNTVNLNQLAIAFATDGASERTGNAMTTSVIQSLQEDGRWFIKDAVWKGRTIMRLSFSSCASEAASIDALVEAIAATWMATQKTVAK